VVEWQQILAPAERHGSPRIEELSRCATPAELLRAAGHPPGAVLLESQGPGGPLARWSFLALAPIASMRALSAGGADAWVELRAGVAGERRAAGIADPLEVMAACTRALAPLRSTRPGGDRRTRFEIPFTAGAVLSIAHEFLHFLEPELTWQHRADTTWPWICARFYGAVLAHDRWSGRTYISETIAGAGETLRRLVAESRGSGPDRVLREPVGYPHMRTLREHSAPRLPITSSQAQLPPWGHASLSAAAHRAAVAGIQARIRAGDTYEANLTLQLTVDSPPPPSQLHQVLRQLGPAAFSAYADLPGFVAISSSPELFLRLRGERIETRPIKGTRPRGNSRADDRRQLRELLLSSKERAENLMICDLSRNDLGRVATIGSVAVPRLCRPQRLPSLFHLVSTITARKIPALSTSDLLRATFPPGSMTGAPKLRTCRIIEEQEGAARGPYAGALGYWNHNQDVDLSVVIRTLISTPARLWLGVGGAITAESDPSAEYAECLAKARLPLAAVALCRGLADPDSPSRPHPRLRMRF
jgi:anthranilate/para-aminobenzoate synthase component I